MHICVFIYGFLFQVYFIYFCFADVIYTDTPILVSVSIYLFGLGRNVNKENSNASNMWVGRQQSSLIEDNFILADVLILQFTAVVSLR